MEGSAPQDCQSAEMQALLEEKRRLKAYLAELERSEERYRIAASNSSEIILEYHVAANTLFHVTDRVTTLYGVPQEIKDAPEYLVSCGAVQPESAEEFIALFRRIATGEKNASMMMKTRTAAGETRWCYVVLTTLFDENGKAERAVGVLKDITSQRMAELQYESEVQYRNAVAKGAVLCYEADLTTRKMLGDLSSVFQQLHLPVPEDYPQVLAVLTANLVHPEDREKVLQAYDADRLLEQFAAGVDKTEVEYRRTVEGVSYWALGTSYLTQDPDSSHVRIYYYVADINDRKLQQLKLQEQAQRDLLTRLYNKVTSEDLISASLAAAPHSEDRVGAFFLVDLDNFKGVNDREGHAFGDRVLEETAQRLLSLCRKDDIAGRLGGDEFVLYLRDLPNAGAAERRAQAICQLFHQNDGSILGGSQATATVGIALYPHHGESFEALYQKADTAMYRAKENGKDGWFLYREEMSAPTPPQEPSMGQERSALKSFDKNVLEYVFRILYQSSNLCQAIGGVLELIATHFHFSRSYIYEPNETGGFSRTFLWTDGQTDPPHQQEISGPALEALHQALGKDGFYRLHPDPGFPAAQDLFARAQYPLEGNGVFLGFIGFDRCGSLLSLSSDQLASLQGVAQMLHVFLAERHSTEKLVESRIMLQAVADSLRSCTYIIDPETYQLRFVNQNTRQIIPQALPGTLCYETVRGRHQPCKDCPITTMLRENRKEYQCEMFLDRYELWAKINTSIIQLADGRRYGLFNGYDFSEYKQQVLPFPLDTQSFTRDTTLYDALSLSTDDYIYMCDMTKNLFYFPKAMVEEFNLPNQVIENAIPLWSTYIHEEDRPDFLQDIDDMVSGKTNFHNQEYRAKNKDGQWVWLRCRGYLEHDLTGAPTLFAGVITNIGKKSKIDHLSGLEDKYEFEMQTRRKMANQPAGGALLLMGLDNFKYINNLYGWEFGDAVIRDTAQQLQSLLPAHAHIYRLDGDVFGVYFSQGNAQAAHAYFQQVHAAFQGARHVEDKRFTCTISGGCACFSGSSAPSFPTLFKQAEFALEYAKNGGKKQLSEYSEELMSGKERVLSLLEKLHESVEQDFIGFEVYYQPQVDATTRKILSCEALLRWRWEGFPNVSPVEFIPLLEQSGLIHQVGRWVLGNVSQTMAKWRKLVPDFTCNVNISFAQLQDKSFLPYLSHQIEAGEINPAALHLEITESCIASGSKSLTEAFRRLRAMGFRIEMDDFGTGYSSLEILKNAPADVVKIDHAFVRDITRSDFDATFIQFVVSLCHSVGIKVCLEGVETWAEYHLVEPMELDLIQGFLFGRPQCVADFERDCLAQLIEKKEPT